MLNAVYGKTQLKTECLSVFTYLKQIVFTHTLIILQLYAVDDKSPLPARWEKNIFFVSAGYLTADLSTLKEVTHHVSSNIIRNT